MGAIDETRRDTKEESAISSRVDRSTQSVSIVVPVYNEEKVISKTVNALAERFPSYELLVIDDGSTDGTGKLLEGLPCRVIAHKPNRGYGATWKTGCMHAEGDIVVFFDGDGQFDPADVQRLLEHHLATGADMTSGSRTKASHTPVLRVPGKYLLKVLARHLARREIPDLNCGLRAFNRQRLKAYTSLLPDGFSASTTSLLAYLKQRHRVEFIPIVTVSREGTSSVRLVRDGLGTIMLIIRMITLFDPLFVFLPTSFVLMAAGLGYSLFVAMESGTGVPVLGATTFLAGLIIFFMGILCDQVSATRLQYIDQRLESD